MRVVRSAGRWPAQILIFLIELYRTYVSPMRMPTCRFTPTCSEYAVEALRERGVVIGVALAVVRLLKCAPWHPGGWDPVPPKRSSATHAKRISRTDTASEHAHASARLDEQRST